MKSKTVAEKRRLCRPGEASDDVRIDPEFQHLMPALAPGELVELHRSIDEGQGCRDAFIVWKGHGLLVEGHHRIAYCRDKGYSFWVVDKEFAEREAVKAFIRRERLARGSLSPVAELYFLGQLYLEAKRQGARTDLTSGKNDQKSTAEQLGEELSRGEKTIRRAAKITQAVDRLQDNCGAGTRNLLLARDAGLTYGGIVKLTKVGPGEQRKVIAELKAGKKLRKPRGAPKKTMTVPRAIPALARTLLERYNPDEIAELQLLLDEGQGKQGSSPADASAHERVGERNGAAAEQALADAQALGTLGKHAPECALFFVNVSFLRGRTAPITRAYGWN